jgi:hypothetical protein
MTLFNTIDYLLHGSARQREAYAALKNNAVITKLEGYSPILVGTIPLNIDIENSDLDILCCYKDGRDFFNNVKAQFSGCTNFRISITTFNTIETVLCNFYCDGFVIEIFGQPVPVRQQAGYRHMITEYKILLKQGETFRQEIIALKNKGYKTEPAFAKLLKLRGDPYTALLDYIII